MNIPLDDLLALSAQLNRQAFAQPPVEGWLNSFLAVLSERFAQHGVLGAQISQVIGNVALRVAMAGHVPAETSPQHRLDDDSPLLAVLRTRRMTTMPNARLYPILVGNEAIGGLIVYVEPRGDYTKLDQALGVLTIQLGPALLQHLKTPGPQTGRLMRQIDVMRSLYAVTRDFTSATESHEILDRAARSLVETLRIDHIGIVVFNADDKSGTVIAEFPDNGMVGMRIPLNNPFEERLFTTRAPVVVNNVDAAHEIGPLRETLQQLGIKSIAVIPMIVQDKLIGSLGMDSFYEYHEFTADEIEAATAITAQLAITAHNAQLYEEIKRRAGQLELIAELSQRVTSTFDQTQIFQIAREETRRIINADMIAVALLNETATTFTVHLLVEGGPVMTSFAADRAALRFVLASGEPLIVDDISGSDDPDYRLFASSRMRAAAIVPLSAGGKSIGAYAVLHREPGYYSGIDLAVLEQVGHQLAIALENARLYMQTSQRAETERLMNRLSGAIQGQSDLQTMLLSTLQEMAEALSARRARVRLELPNKLPGVANKGIEG